MLFLIKAVVDSTWSNTVLPWRHTFITGTPRHGDDAAEAPGLRERAELCWAGFQPSEHTAVELEMKWVKEI